MCYHCGTTWFPWRKSPHTCYQAVVNYRGTYPPLYHPSTLALLRLQRTGQS